MGRQGARGLPRVVDASLAALGLLLMSPVIVALAVLVRLTSPGPAFFEQRRAGRGGCPFALVKLRTMIADQGGARTPSAQVTARGDARITSLGRVLRRFKLDELPQLWNVVRGDMALVGPRPEVPRFVDVSDPLWQAVLSVRPGLTDVVTLRLRDEESLLAEALHKDGSVEPERFYRQTLLPWKLRGAVDYERRRTPWRDLGVLTRTVFAIALPAGEPLTLDELAAERKRPEPT